MDHVTALRQISVTALFYLENSRRIHPQSIRACQPKDTKRREWKSMPERRREKESACTGGGVGGWGREEGGRERKREHASALAPPFICFFLPLGLTYENWASQGCCLFYLKSSLQSLDLPLTFLCSIFTGFSLPCLLATAILDSCCLF